MAAAQAPGLRRTSSWAVAGIGLLLLAVLILCAACTELAAPGTLETLLVPSGERVFEGVYIATYEFPPYLAPHGCGTYPRYGLAYDSGSGFYERLIELDAVDASGEPLTYLVMQDRAMYVRLVGRLEAPAFDSSTPFPRRKVVVTRLLEMHWVFTCPVR